VRQTCVRCRCATTGISVLREYAAVYLKIALVVFRAATHNAPECNVLHTLWGSLCIHLSADSINSSHVLFLRFTSVIAVVYL
jgi:hypothetical protein